MIRLNLKGHKGMGKKIAFIGSSGGNLYKQGGNNLPAMMKEICGQTKAADMEIMTKAMLSIISAIRMFMI